jgi:hypothetical protein
MQPESNPTMRVAWQRLIRFQAADGRILQGEPIPEGYGHPRPEI